MACATVCYRGACLSGALLILQEIREEFFDGPQTARKRSSSCGKLSVLNL